MSQIVDFKIKCDMCGCKLKNSNTINKMTMHTIPSLMEKRKDGIYYLCDHCTALIQCKLKHRI